MKNNYYTLNELIKFFRKFNLNATYGLYSDTDSIYIKRKDVIKMNEEYYSISIAYFNENENNTGKQVTINNPPDLETALKRVYNHKRMIKSSAKKGINTIYDISIRHYIKASTGQFINDVTIQNGNIIVY